MILARRTFRLALAGTVLSALLATSATAQIAADDEPAEGPRYGTADVIRFRVGAEITASRGACRNIVAMVAIPLECPEQDVTIVNEEISSEVAEVSYRTLQCGVRQMVISVPFLPNGATARAVVTAEVGTRPILPPERTDHLTIPSRVPANLRMYVNPSPYIETKHRTIRALAKEIVSELDESVTDWQKVEVIYDTVLERIDYFEGPDKSAVESLRDGHADCQGRSAVFIALCRANEIPARMVWVDGHAFPEFYLEHAEGEGHWYPCESAGSRAFGEMPLARTVLQKGDNFRVPERPRERLRYATDFMIGLPTPGGGQPSHRFIREQVPL